MWKHTKYIMTLKYSKIMIPKIQLHILHVEYYIFNGEL